MKWKEVKRRVALARLALRGEPLVWDIFKPKFVVDSQRIETIRAEFEVSRPDADMVGHEAVAKMAKTQLLDRLVKGLEKSGAVQIVVNKAPLSILYQATLRVILPWEEERE